MGCKSEMNKTMFPCPVEEEFRGGSYKATVYDSVINYIVIAGRAETEQGEYLPISPVVNGVVIPPASDSSGFTVLVQAGRYSIVGQYKGFNAVCTEELELQNRDSAYVEFTLEVHREDWE